MNVLRRSSFPRPNVPAELSPENLSVPPPPIEGETPAIRRFRDQFLHRFINIRQPEIPEIWNEWDPAKGQSKASDNDWPQYDPKSIRSGEGLMVNHPNLPEKQQSHTRKSQEKTDAQTQTGGLPPGSPEATQISIPDPTSNTIGASGEIVGTNEMPSPQLPANVSATRSQIPNKIASRMWDVATPGSGVLTFNDAEDYVSALAGASMPKDQQEQMEDQRKKNTRKDANTITKASSESASTTETPTTKSASERPTQSSWFSEGSIWSV